MTDDWDRRVLYTYINDFFKDEAIEAPYFKLVTDYFTCACTCTYLIVPY